MHPVQQLVKITYCDVIVVFHALSAAALRRGQTAVNSPHSRSQLHILLLPCTRISSQSQQNLATQSSPFCLSLLSRLFFISVIISFLLICYISLFPLFLFVSAILCNPLP